MVPRLQVLAAALLFSTGGAAIKATTLTSWQVAGFRSGVAALVLLLLIPATRRGWNARTGVIAASYAVTLVAFVNANKLTTAANAIFLQATAPLYLLIFGPFLIKERAGRSDLLVILTMAVGMTLFLWGGQTATASAPDPVRGNLYAMIAGFAYAIVIGGFRLIEKDSRGGENPGLATTALGNVIAFLVCLPMAVPVATHQSIDWVVIGYLGVIQIGLAYVLLTRGVRGVTALEASLLLLAEPALNPIWAGLMHGEWPGGLALAGGGLILGATALSTLRR